VFGQKLAKRGIDRLRVAKHLGHVRFEKNDVRPFPVALVILAPLCTGRRGLLSNLVGITFALTPTVVVRPRSPDAGRTATR